MVEGLDNDVCWLNKKRHVRKKNRTRFSLHKNYKLGKERRETAMIIRLGKIVRLWTKDLFCGDWSYDYVLLRNQINILIRTCVPQLKTLFHPQCFNENWGKSRPFKIHVESDRKKQYKNIYPFLIVNHFFMKLNTCISFGHYPYHISFKQSKKNSREFSFIYVRNTIICYYQTRLKIYSEKPED